MNAWIEPADAGERRRLRDDLGRTLFVEAGAGSGKTTQLVGRIEQLIVTGRLPDIGALAAITFTEAAAAELRVRLRDRLERARRAQPPGSVEATRIGAALDRLDDAAISTLHGFAFRLLAAHPLEAGLPPGFEVEDEIAAVVGDRERWADFLDELFADAAIEPVLRRALTLGLTLRQLDGVGRDFAANWDRLEAAEHFTEHPLAPVDVAPVVAAIDDVLSWARQCAPHRFVDQVLDELDAVRRRLLEEPDPEHRMLVLQHEMRGAYKPGNLGKRADLKSLKERTDALATVRADLLRSLRVDALEPILARTRAFTLQEVEARCRAGRLRFHDLLVLARRLLAGQPVIRAQLGRRFDVLLIDEFQDTDPLQVEIALLLGMAVDGDAPARWQDIQVGEGRLFFVGDPKQSIYRFRRADIEVFSQVRDRFAGDGGVELSVNFRTVPSILEWVNAVFGAVIGTGADDGQPAYRPLTAARPELVPGPAVTLVGDEDDHRNVAVMREVEAADVAATIVRMRAEGWPVAGDGGGVRPARYQDVAVLLPTRSILSELERALEREGVPYRIESRSLVYATDAVREVLAVLQAVDDPSDEVAVVAALRSPGLACSDDALARFRNATAGLTGARWDPTTELPDEVLAVLGDDDPVVAGRALLARLHERRHWLSVSALVGEVVDHLRLVELTTAHRRPRDHWRRVRLVQDEARAFVEAGGEALGDFVAYIEQQADEQASRVETVVPEPDDDAVRILTVHGSKGLEFPAVVVAGLGTDYRPRYNQPVLWTEAGPEISFGRAKDTPFETPGWTEAFARDEQLERFEQDRLLYVAATRARDQLVVSLHRKAGANPKFWSPAARIADVLTRVDAGSWRRLGDEPPPGAQPDGCTAAGAAGAPPEPIAGDRPASDAEGPVLSHEVDRFTAGRQALLGAAARRGVLTPTGLARRALPPNPDVDDGADAAVSGDVAGPAVDASSAVDVDDDEEREPATDPAVVASGFARRGGGTDVGRAVHATLQLVDFATGADLSAVAARAAAADGVVDRVGLVERLARSALSSTPVAEARASGRWWRELFVSAPLGPDEALVEGYVDLLYEDVDGNLVVVDYKTDQARDDAALEAAFDRYRLQAATYAAVVGAALGRPVARCVFVFARPSGPAAERVIDDVPAAVADVLAALAGGAAVPA